MQCCPGVKARAGGRGEHGHALYSVQYTACSVQYTACSFQYTVSSVQCAVYSLQRLQSVVRSVQCTL